MSISDGLRGVLTNWLSMESVCVGIWGSVHGHAACKKPLHVHLRDTYEHRCVAGLSV